MKTKKIVIGAMAVAMLSLSVCSFAPALAADETVQISVGSAEVEAGGTFTVDVSIADIPAEGIQGAQFTLNFDSSVITIDSVEEGALLKSVTSDPTASVLPSFNSFKNNDKGILTFMWATSVDKSDYLLKGEGVFCTVTGTVSENAKPGKSEIKIVATNRETFTDSGVVNEDIDIGYNKNGEKIRYNVETTNGIITVKDGEVEQPTTENPVEKPTTSGKVLKGDANEDGAVNMADVTAIVQHIGNRDAYGLTETGLANADTTGDGQVTGEDALYIQHAIAGEIEL